MTEVTIKNYGQITIGSGGGSSVDLAEIERRLKNLVVTAYTGVVLSISDIVSSYSNRTWNDAVETFCITTTPWLSDFRDVTDTVNDFSTAGVWYINNASGGDDYREGITTPVVYNDGSAWRFALPGDVINPSYSYDIWTEDKTVVTDNINTNP